MASSKAGTQVNPDRAPLGRAQASPWRGIFEDVRRVIGNRRDENGVLGSINWLRQQMQARGANPNVVRNIIYRDKGKLADKRVLFEIFSQLWEGAGQPPLRAPELEVLLSAGNSAEQEVMQLLGREKRKAYRGFVGGVRGGEHPKLLVTGRPGSGKTLLVDYIQQALELPPRAAESIVRLEFSSQDLAGSLSRLAAAVGVDAELFEAKLVKIGMSGAYAVQADAQADVARVILEAVRAGDSPRVMLLHISQSLGPQDSLGMAPLRLNTPEVPRVNASEWLWLTLLEPMSRLAHLSLLVTMTDLPARALQQLGGFEGPVRLNPPTASEARRFVRARLPQLPPSEQEALVQRAGRSFEELRTLTLLAETRELPGAEGAGGNEAHLERLGQLVVSSGDPRLRDFLAAFAVLSLPEFPTFHGHTLAQLRRKEWRETSSLEQAFLDPVPGQDGHWRSFSRQLARQLRQRLAEAEPERYRALSGAAARSYAEAADRDPKGEAAGRYLHHLFEARDWATLEQWLGLHSVPQSLLRRIWQVASEELSAGPAFEGIALQVAGHYVKLGSYQHPDAKAALAVLAASEKPEVRAWTQLKRAEGAVLRGQFDRAEAMLADWPEVDDPTLRAELELVRASIARWRAQLGEAGRLVAEGARPLLALVPARSAAGKLVHAKVAVWAGLIAKDQGDLEGALLEFDSVATDDDLIRARIAFQKGDVQLELGRFDHALAALSSAVTLSHRSEAPLAEQARYLARRATLHRRRGELSLAQEDFEAALSVLALEPHEAGPLEPAFERAKVEDERALLLLAQGRFDEAVFGLQRNLQTFRDYQATRRVDAGFRLLRTTLRLALAYWCRGHMRPYRQPLAVAALALHEVEAGPENADLRHARALAAEVLTQITSHPGGRARFGPLYRQSLLRSSLLAKSAAEAERFALASLEGARFAYLESVSRAHLSAALLRGGKREEALGELERSLAAYARTLQDGGGPESGDVGLLAWLRCLELQSRIALGQVEEVGRLLAAGLDDPRLARFHEALLRAFGEAVETDLARGWLEHEALQGRLGLQDGALGRLQVRLPDALVAHWQELKTPLAVT